MADVNTFVPYKPETMRTMEVSVREAQVIDIIRKTSFGKFTVHKANGVIVRIERDESIMITDDEKVEMQQKKE